MLCELAGDDRGRGGRPIRGALGRLHAGRGRRELGHPIDWHATFGVRHHEVFEAELVAVDGVTDVVAALLEAGVPCASRRAACASPSTSSSTAQTCGTPSPATCSSGTTSPTRKPAPDLFLHAAASMGVAPSGCAVVEDSVAGVAAGIAAGMTVFAYAGGVTSAERLARPEVTVFHEMPELLELLAASAGDDVGD